MVKFTAFASAVFLALTVLASNWPGGVLQKPAPPPAFDAPNYLILVSPMNVKFCPDQDTVGGGGATGQPGGWQGTPGGGWEFIDFTRTYTWPSVTFAGEFKQLTFAVPDGIGQIYAQQGNWYADDYIPCGNGNQGGN